MQKDDYFTLLAVYVTGRLCNLYISAPVRFWTDFQADKGVTYGYKHCIDSCVPPRLDCRTFCERRMIVWVLLSEICVKSSVRPLSI